MLSQRSGLGSAANLDDLTREGLEEDLARISQTPLVICQFEPEISSRGRFAEPGDGLDCG